MKWLLTGAGGMPGRGTVDELTRRGERVTAPDQAALDPTRAEAVERAFTEHHPDIVVNRAARTAVDDAESDEERATPCPEDHPTAPRTAYGRSELAGERAVPEELPGASAVVRTAWPYGVHGRSFVRTTIGLEARRPAVDVVDDRRGQPTRSVDVAERIADLGPRLGDDVHGVLHTTGSGEATWYEPVGEVFRLIGAVPERVRPTTGAAFPRPPPRPAYSALAHGRRQDIGLPAPRDRRVALHEALPRIRKESPLRETP
ncbi:sugar nucleotide-binding protein [Streptomyces sp. M2CJ-2]|uniref:SDR family oxidoreductase n=1 Tax=Streptomyces sp. M2CJ-2 TaxID=2803948 RepID=UPI0019207C37|nr:sugar nucleotide-binding protein [Streptomyces sp. M2CJ-2]MBL3666097.1 sugar nucleotide-binding protein [Streptomyces sp. M2CJ-2]